MKYFEGFYINGWFGHWQTWLLLGIGLILASIITSLIFGAIARYDRRVGK